MTPDALARMESEILTRRMQGERSDEIATAMQVPHGNVLAAIARLTEQARQESADMAAELFMLANLRLEKLWRTVQKWLDAMETFDDKLVRCAVSVLERQAKMNGLDKQGSRFVADDEWIDNATPAEVVAHAKKLGLSLPEHVVIQGI